MLEAAVCLGAVLFYDRALHLPGHDSELLRKKRKMKRLTANQLLWSEAFVMPLQLTEHRLPLKHYHLRWMKP